MARAGCHQASKMGTLALPLIGWQHAGREGPRHRPEAPHQLLPGKDHRAPSLSDAGSGGRRQKGRESVSSGLLLKAPSLGAPRESEVTIS